MAPGNRREQESRRAGFTLIELAAVTLLLAILAGAAAWTFSGPIAAVRASDVVGRVRTFDATARQATTGSIGAAAMIFDRDDGSLLRYDETPGGDSGVAYRASLPPKFRIEQVRTAGAPVSELGGRVTIGCAAGRTPTYAVHLVGPELDRWLVFAGLSGQVTEVIHEAEVDAILETAARTKRATSRDREEAVGRCTQRPNHRAESAISSTAEYSVRPLPHGRGSMNACATSRRGMTLTEVIAGLVLLTTVLSAVFIARGRFLRQWADADRQIAASRAVDSLLGEWLAGTADRVPVPGEGILGGVEGCRWTTHRVVESAANRLGAKVIRLEVTRTEIGVNRADRPVLAVEFLLPDDRSDSSPRAGGN